MIYCLLLTNNWITFNVLNRGGQILFITVLYLRQKLRNNYLLLYVSPQIYEKVSGFFPRLRLLTINKVFLKKQNSLRMYAYAKTFAKLYTLYSSTKVVHKLFRQLLVKDPCYHQFIYTCTYDQILIRTTNSNTNNTTSCIKPKN